MGARTPKGGKHHIYINIPNGNARLRQKNVIVVAISVTGLEAV
jgi:hypothetical protein